MSLPLWRLDFAHPAHSNQCMSSELWRGLLALGRSVELAGAVPAIGRRAVAYVAAYQRVVAPIVRSSLDRSGPPRYLDGSMCEVCAKLCFLLAGYAATAGVPFRADLAVLGGAVARVYDDLIDEYGDGELGERLAGLFDGGGFTPVTPVERLLSALYLELERRLGRDRDDPVYRALIALHDEQIRSRHQRDPAIRPATLADITRAKGGYATVVLFALLRPAMDDREQALIRELGGTLQLLDDYVDAVADRTAGITTSATRGALSLDHICRRLRSLRPALRDYYRRDQPLCGVVYLHVWMCYVRRHWPAGRPAGTPTRMLTSLVRAGACRKNRNADTAPLSEDD